MQYHCSVSRVKKHLYILQTIYLASILAKLRPNPETQLLEITEDWYIVN